MDSSRITDLSCKEVINICDGTRFGFVNDIEIDCACGTVVSIIVPGPSKFPWFFRQKDDYIIPWDAIRRIGDDIILVDYKLKVCPSKQKRSWFS
ncbi:MAG: YlmC/YmxH family sporulation protein [Clostridia bacterium]